MGICKKKKFTSLVQELSGSSASSCPLFSPFK